MGKLMTKPNKLLEECNFDFDKVFSDDEIYSKDICRIIKNYTRSELSKAHKISQERIESGLYKGSEGAKQIALLHDCLINKYLDRLSMLSILVFFSLFGIFFGNGQRKSGLR